MSASKVTVQRYCLYHGLSHSGFTVPVGVYDTPEAAADAARRVVLDNIKRVNTVGDPRELAVLVLPVSTPAETAP